MRGAPQVGFSATRRKIKVRISLLTRFRPPNRLTLEIHAARLLRMQSQQLSTESQVLEDEVLPRTESADQPTEEMSKRHNHGKNCIGKI